MITICAVLSNNFKKFSSLTFRVIKLFRILLDLSIWKQKSEESKVILVAGRGARARPKAINTIFIYDHQDAMMRNISINKQLYLMHFYNLNIKK